MRLQATLIGALTVCVIALSGCATSNSGTVTSDQDENSAIEAATITTRTITFPAVYFQNKDAETVTAALEEKGATDITANEDGSYTATLPIEKYNELVDAMNTQIAESFDTMVEEGDFPNLAKVEYTEGFSKVTFTLKTNEIGFQDAFLTLAGAVPACMYQQIAGLHVDTQLVILGADGSTLLDKHYPEAWKEAEDQSKVPQFSDQSQN